MTQRDILRAQELRRRLNLRERAATWLRAEGLDVGGAPLARHTTLLATWTDEQRAHRLRRRLVELTPLPPLHWRTT